VRQWWTLRERFRKSIPGTVSTNYLSTALNMTEKSAQNNVLPGLRTMGIIDENGKPTDLAVKWRDDAQYPKVCESIRKSVYPKELIDIAPDASAHRGELQRWFGNQTGAGDNAVSKMSAMYLLLSEADPKKAPNASKGKAAKATGGKERRAKPEPGVRAGRSADAGDPKFRRSDDESPALHINIQVHISSDATPDQIDQIFSSMAKHLYKRVQGDAT
jgi:hypothetical protein